MNASKPEVMLTDEEHTARAMLLGFHYDSDLSIYRTYTTFGIWMGPNFDADTMEELTDDEFKRRWNAYAKLIGVIS